MNDSSLWLVDQCAVFLEGLYGRLKQQGHEAEAHMYMQRQYACNDSLQREVHNSHVRYTGDTYGVACMLQSIVCWTNQRPLALRGPLKQQA